MRLYALALSICLAFCSNAEANITCKYTGKDGSPANEAEWRVAVKHQYIDEYKMFDANCDGVMSSSEKAAYNEWKDNVTEEAVVFIKRRIDAGKKVTVGSSGNIKPDILGTEEPDPKLASGWIPLLRESFEDVSIFSRPKDVKSASGASFSWSRDGTIDNSVWAAKGVVSYAYTHTETRPDATSPYIIGYAFAPAISFDRSANSSTNKKSKDTDILSFSATSELGISSGNGAAQYFRFRPAYVTDFDGDGKSWSLTAEWQPYVVGGSGFDVSSANPIGSFVWELDPMLRLQYAHELNNSGGPLFDQNDNPLRIGPVFGFSVNPKGNADLPGWIQKAALTASYEYLVDVETGNSYPLFTAGLNFNLDDDGHTALKVSYSKGKVEETAESVDKILVGLSAKW